MVSFKGFGERAAALREAAFIRTANACSQRQRKRSAGVWGVLHAAFTLSTLVVATSLIAPTSVVAQMLDPNNPSGSPLGNRSSGSQRQSDEETRSQRSEDNGADQARATVYEPAKFQQTQIGSGAAAATVDSASATGSTSIKPPAAPGEFERYVRQFAGRDIRRFGFDLLVPADRDFATPATTTVPPDYAVSVGDTISINLTGSIEGGASFTVDRDGRIFVPKVGEISVVGVRNRDLHDHIARVIGQQYRGYDVSVSIARLRGLRIYVTGFANNPGSYTVNSLSTLVNAVFAAGGPAAGGSFRMVELRRNGRLVTKFDLYALLRNGITTNDVVLENEDVLVIPPAGNQVAVLGSVNQQAIYETRPGESIAQALAYAGGTTPLADNSRVVLYRLTDKGTVGSREISLAAAAAEPIVSGDIIQVLSSGSLVHPLERQSVVVRLEGEVNRPGNYYVAPNTPLSQVLELAGGLTPRAYVYGTMLSRDSVRAQQRVSYREALDQLEMTLVGAPLTGSGIGETDRAGQLAAANGVLEKLRSAEPDGRMVLSIPYGSRDLPGDLVLENNDVIKVPPLVRTVGVFGSVYRPASFLLPDGKPMRVSDYVNKAGGATRIADRASIFVVRANGEVVSHRRGALSARVQPGDVIFVPVKSQSASLFAKIRDIAAIVFQLGITTAAVAAIQ